MVNNVLKYEIVIDLCKDYTDIVRAQLAARHIFSTQDGEKLWYEYFNLLKKSIPRKKRTVKISKEFKCPEDMSTGLAKLAEQIKRGNDLNVYLSKDAGNPSKFDGLLYDWGIYHFHLGEEIDKKTGMIKRTGPILFARIDEETVYFINVYKHGRGSSPWAKQEMVKIIHNNWPQTIANFKMEVDLTNEFGVKTQFPDTYYEKARREGSFVLVQVDKGIAYAPIGNGLASSRHSIEIISHCDDIYNCLKDAEEHVINHLCDFVDIIEDTGHKIDDKMHFRLWIRDKRFYVVELLSKVEILGVDI